MKIYILTEWAVSEFSTTSVAVKGIVADSFQEAKDILFEALSEFTDQSVCIIEDTDIILRFTMFDGAIYSTLSSEVLSYINKE